MITEHLDWIFTGVFYDAGKSGLRRSGRTGLDKMLKKVAKGKIDYIITKSISRVSRDTVEVIKIVRYLRERSINMYLKMKFELHLGACLHRMKVEIPAKHSVGFSTKI